MMTKDICSTTYRRACNGATQSELPTNITGTVGTTFSYSAAVPCKTRSRNTPTTTKAKRNWWIIIPVKRRINSDSNTIICYDTTSSWMPGPGSNTLLTKTRQQENYIPSESWIGYTTTRILISSNGLSSGKSAKISFWNVSPFQQESGLTGIVTRREWTILSNRHHPGYPSPTRSLPNGLSMQMPDDIINFPRTPRWDMPTSKET